MWRLGNCKATTSPRTTPRAASAAAQRSARSLNSPNDVMPSLEAETSPYPLDLAAYRDVVLDRFSNPYLRDTNQRVAADGFAKIPGFLWPTFRECLARGASTRSAKSWCPPVLPRSSMP